MGKKHELGYLFDYLALFSHIKKKDKCPNVDDKKCF